MIEWLKDLLWNQGKFIGAVRALLIGAGVAVAALPAEVLGDAPGWVRIAGIVLVAIGAFIRAGDRNPKGVELSARFEETDEDPARR